MTYKQFNKFCRSLPATTYVVQWGGAHVWKVGGKVFAIGGWQDDEASFTFKVSDIAYEMLKEQPACVRRCRLLIHAPEQVGDAVRFLVLRRGTAELSDALLGSGT